MVALLKKLWRSDLFGIFCLNLLALIVSVYLAIAFFRNGFILALAIAAANLLYLFVLLVIRLRVLTSVVDMVREHPLQEVKNEDKRLVEEQDPHH